MIWVIFFWLAKPPGWLPSEKNSIFLAEAGTFGRSRQKAAALET